jgi:hypothetical protein
VGTSIVTDKGGHGGGDGGGGQQGDHGGRDDHGNNNQGNNQGNNEGPGNSNNQGNSNQGNNQGNNNQGNQGNNNQGNNNQGNNNQGNQNQQRVRFDIGLTAPAANALFPAASGSARFESRSDRTELRVEVERIPGGTALTILVNGVQVGTAMTFGTGASGEAELELSTRNGDTIPAVQAGSTITVQTADGKVVVSGTF